MKIIGVNLTAPAGATDRSPRRKPWVSRRTDIKPRMGRQKRSQCADVLYRPLRGLPILFDQFPQLTPWATIFRRSAAGQPEEVR